MMRLGQYSVLIGFVVFSRKCLIFFMFSGINANMWYGYVVFTYFKGAVSDFFFIFCSVTSFDNINFGATIILKWLS